jgi:hypothetical protein
MSSVPVLTNQEQVNKHVSSSLKHAVVTNDRIFLISPERKLCARSLNQLITHISDLWRIGQELHITHFWIMPGTLIDEVGYTFLEKREGYNIFVPLAEKAEFPRGARCWKENASGTHQIILSYPAREPFSWEVKHPLDVLACVDYLEQVLGLSIQWSPQSIGTAFLERQYTTKRLQSLLQEGLIDQKKLPFRKAAPEIMFKRSLSHDMVGKYLHMVDKNSAHPSAASSMVTGVGDPTHITFEACPWRPPQKGEHRQPGIYKVSVADRGTSIFDGKSLPQIISSEWITLDVLLYAVKQGYTVKVHEAWVFAQSYKLFDEWARDLWKARQALKDEQRFPYTPGRENAYTTIKNIMNRTISSSTHRNWWADMVGLARVARLANLEKFAKAGHTLTLVYVDDMGFICDHPHPETALPDVLDRQDKMGGYKLKYTLQITETMINDCNQFAKAGPMITYLNNIARQEGWIF